MPALLQHIGDILPEFSAGEKGRALDALAFLARSEKHPNRDEVFALLAKHLNHPMENVRAAAARSLGTLRNPKALALLRPLTAVKKPYNDPVRPAGEKSIQDLEAQLAQPQELGDVWSKMQDLQKKTEDLEKQLEKLGKKVAPEKPSSDPGKQKTGKPAQAKRNAPKP